jgi:hypothetical protein
MWSRPADLHQQGARGHRCGIGTCWRPKKQAAAHVPALTRPALPGIRQRGGTMSDLMTRAEIIKLARALNTTADQLSFLQRLGAKDLRHLREHVSVADPACPRGSDQSWREGLRVFRTPTK